MIREIFIGPSVIELSREICIKAQKEANYFPIDRHFLEKYLEKILKFEPLEFIFCNIENLNNTYSVQLFCCLPELWTAIKFEDIILLIYNFSNIFSYYTFIEFTYKFLEIDIIDIIMRHEYTTYKNKLDIFGFIKNQYYNLIKDDDSYNDFTFELLGISYEKFAYIKQVLLLDNRIKPACITLQALKNSIDQYDPHSCRFSTYRKTKE